MSFPLLLSQAPRRSRAALPGLLLLGVSLLTLVGGAQPARAASTPPSPTSSRYMSTTDPATAYAQGKADGQAGRRGATILDFGRPAMSGVTSGTLDFAGHFDSDAAILTAAERYADAYYDYSPSYTVMHLMLGSSNSCGTGQPCGGIVCGCGLQPTSFTGWGQAWGRTTTALESYLRAKPSYYTTVMHGDAADDAEPGYDPAFTNTANLLAGYAASSTRPLADYGSLDGGPCCSAWTAAQQYQVAYGFAPDVPFGEIYYAGQAAQWAALDHWSVVNKGHKMTMFGVLTQYPHGGYSPSQGYTQMLTDLNTLYPDTGQSSIQWLSNIG